MHCTPIKILQLCISLASDCFSLLDYPIDDHLHSSARQNLHTKYWLLDNHQHTECIQTVAQEMPANGYTKQHQCTCTLISLLPGDQLIFLSLESPPLRAARDGWASSSEDWTELTLPLSTDTLQWRREQNYNSFM